MVYGYIRVSTEKQNLKNQKLEIRKFCKIKRLRNIKFIAETVSGTKNPLKRKLGKLIADCVEGDTIVCTELSRLGRSLLMIMSVLEECMDKGVTITTIKEGFEMGDNLQSRVIAFAFGLASEIERTLLSERTKQGLERARKEGKQIGRLLGQKPKRYKLTPKKRYIKKALEAGRSKLSLAKELGVTWVTLNNFLKRNDYIR